VISSLVDGAKAGERSIKMPQQQVQDEDAIGIEALQAEGYARTPQRAGLSYHVSISISISI
jgi:hypothetical protein